MVKGHATYVKSEVCKRLTEFSLYLSLKIYQPHHHLADIMAFWLHFILLIFLPSAKSVDYLDYTDCFEDWDCEDGYCCYGDIQDYPGLCFPCGITLKYGNCTVWKITQNIAIFAPLFATKLTSHFPGFQPNLGFDWLNSTVRCLVWENEQKSW